MKHSLHLALCPSTTTAARNKTGQRINPTLFWHSFLLVLLLCFFLTFPPYVSDRPFTDIFGCDRLRCRAGECTFPRVTVQSTPALPAICFSSLLNLFACPFSKARALHNNQSASSGKSALPFLHLCCTEPQEEPKGTHILSSVTKQRQN